MSEDFESDNIKVVSITPELNIPISLMNLADEIQKGDLGEVKNLTVLVNGGIYHFGDISDETATKNAHWNIGCALQKIQMLALQSYPNDEK